MRLEFPYDTNSHQTACSFYDRLGNTFEGTLVHNMPSPSKKKKPSPCTLHTSLIRILCVETAEHFSLFLLLASKPAPYKAGNVLVTCSHYCCGCPTHLQLWCCSGSFGSFEGLEVKEMRVEMPAIPPHVRALPSLPPPSRVRKSRRRASGVKSVSK